MKKFILFWLPVILWMGFIYFLSSFHKIQVTEVGWANFVTRKLAHLTEYAILCFLFFRGFKKTTKISLMEALMLSLVLTVIYSLTDEFHQTFISGRTGKALDILIDFMGAFIGFIISWKFIPLLPKRVRENLI